MMVNLRGEFETMRCFRTEFMYNTIFRRPLMGSIALYEPFTMDAIGPSREAGVRPDRTCVHEVGAGDTTYLKLLNMSHL